MGQGRLWRGEIQTHRSFCLNTASVFLRQSIWLERGKRHLKLRDNGGGRLTTHSHQQHIALTNGYYLRGCCRVSSKAGEPNRIHPRIIHVGLVHSHPVPAVVPPIDMEPHKAIVRGRPRGTGPSGICSRNGPILGAGEHSGYQKMIGPFRGPAGVAWRTLFAPERLCV